MINWLRKRKLHGLVEKLAIYNDKGMHWSHHSNEQAEIEREKVIGLIKKQISLIGSNNVSKELLKALESGELKTDITGSFIKYAK